MNLSRIGTNEALIRFGDSTEVFYSYETPVAGYTIALGFFRTSKKFSVTTTRHINKYLQGCDAEIMSQESIEVFTGAL